jgi:glutamine cyclotransferase
MLSGCYMNSNLKILITFLIVIITLCILYYLYSNSASLFNTGSNDSNNSDNSKNQTNTPIYTFKIINTYPHDPEAFTQGLDFENGTLYEGTGLYGKSSLRKIDLETGKILQIRNLSSEFFGEGVSVFGNRIIQLTWKANIGFIYDKNTFDLLHEFNYSTEGWGVTHDGNRIIISDGTDTLYFLDPETYEVVDEIKVFDETGPVTRLNELEYIQGEIYANVWQTDRIAVISPQTGEVTRWIELDGLQSEEDNVGSAGVLNGIAYDEKNNRLIVTGKLWPKIFEIELFPKK